LLMARRECQSPKEMPTDWDRLAAVLACHHQGQAAFLEAMASLSLASHGHFALSQTPVAYRRGSPGAMLVPAVER